MSSKAIQALLETYNELNPPFVAELDEEPSALEFLHYVARNRPFVIRKGATSWNASQKWSAEYLNRILGETTVNAAITPYGNADAVLTSEDGSLVFVKPYEQQENFADFLHEIIYQQSLKNTAEDEDAPPVRYGQTQNDNLRNEYSDIFDDVPPTIPFARIALRKPPDAVNFWLGNSLSVTSLHKDNYENIYAQIIGQKHFVLLPPVAAPCVSERELPAYTYTRSRSLSADSEARQPLRKADLRATPDDPPSSVPVATWDPDSHHVRATPFSPYVRPIRVTLNPGDMLYLPAMWYHKVSQSCGEEGFCCAVNYWYDMDFAGGFWATNAFLRDIASNEVG